MIADRSLDEVGGGARRFSAFAAELIRHEGRRAAIDALYRAPETEVMPALVADLRAGRVQATYQAADKPD